MLSFEMAARVAVPSSFVSNSASIFIKSAISFLLYDHLLSSEFPHEAKRMIGRDNAHNTLVVLVFIDVSSATLYFLGVFLL